MARYTGPKSKIARKFGEPIFGPDKVLDKKNYGPGQHGNTRRRGKKSEYAIQLAEKQKAKYTYGILEKQFSNLFKESLRRKGITGEILLQLCETRLDNTVYRLGLAATRNAARQLISHKHFLVNNNLVNIPSYLLSNGDIIQVRDKSKRFRVFQDSMRRIQGDNPMPWLSIDKSKLNGIFNNFPERDEIPESFNEQLVVELYSK